MKIKLNFGIKLNRHNVLGDDVKRVNAWIETDEGRRSISLNHNKEFKPKKETHKNRVGGFARTFPLLGNWSISTWTQKDIPTLCGLSKDIDLAWILDEFDSSFNELAAASLKYHMDHAITSSGSRYKHYQQIREGLLATIDEQDIALPPEENEHVQKRFDAWLNQETKDFCLCSVCKKVMDNHEKVRNETEQIRNKARQDFIAVIPELWS